MARVQFVETVLLPGGPAGTLVPVKGVAATPHIINSDQSEGAQATAYVDRTSMTQPASLATDVSGTVSFWLDSGDYNVHIDDQQSPPRIASYIRGFTAPVIDTNQLVVAAQNLIQFTGDTKFSLQTADHGLKADGTYEWLLVTNNADGGGRKVDHTLYPGIWSLLGSPTPDGAGMFRLPNISGKALIASGHASGLSNRNLLDIIGEESHIMTIAEMASHTHTDAGHGHTDGGHSHAVNDPAHAHNVGNLSNIASAALDIWFSGDGHGAFTSPGIGTQGTDGQVTGIGINLGFASINNGFASIQPTGSGSAHNNMPPSACLNLFVKS